MEILVNREDIYNGLLKTQSIIEKRSTMPILSNVLLDAKDDTLKIKATDLEIGIDTSHTATVVTSGSITIPGKKLFELVRETEERELRLTKRDGNHLEVRSGKAVFNILGLPAEDFPSFPSYEEYIFFKLPAKIFSRMIEKTVYTVSTDEIRYTLNGVFFEKTDNAIKMVATDGHRLSLITYKDELIKEMELGKGVIIPRKGAGELKRLLEDGAEDFIMHIKDNNGVFKIGNTVLTMRMIEGDFPDYKQVIPSKTEKETEVNRELLTKALKRVSIVSSEKSRGVKISFRKDQVEVFTANPDIGEASETVEADYRGNEITMGFNARYMLEMLNSIDEEFVRIGLNDEFGPVIVKGRDGEDHLSIIMPMRL